MDATATARNIQTGYTAYCRGKKIVGTATVIPPTSVGTITKYSGTITGLSRNTGDGLYKFSPATSIGDYILFCAVNGANIVDVYDGYSLIKSTKSSSIYIQSDAAATSIENYAIFAGGAAQSSNVGARVNAYNSSLTISYPTDLSQFRGSLAAASVGAYALFGGGEYQTSGWSYTNIVDAYDGSLTRSNPTRLAAGVSKLAATNNPNYAIFGGGSMSASVSVYDYELTRSTPTGLSTGVLWLGAASVGDYMLFAGGGTEYNYIEPVNTVNAYDSTLTKSNPAGLSYSCACPSGINFGDYALFAGGISDGFYNDKVAYSNIDTYNLSLTKSTTPSLSQSRGGAGAATAGDYCLFGGGCTKVSYTSLWVGTSTVDAYYIS